MQFRKTVTKLWYYHQGKSQKYKRLMQNLYLKKERQGIIFITENIPLWINNIRELRNKMNYNKNYEL